MSALLAVSPVLVPLLTAAACVALARRPRLQAGMSLAGAIAWLACALLLVRAVGGGEVLVTRFGDWPAPFAIEFRIDPAGALLIAASALLAVLALAVPARGGGTGMHSPLRHPLVHGLLAGVGGAYATGDLFNLYVWYEVMLISALGLIVLGGRAQHLEAGFKYLTLNLFGTILVLLAIAGLYGLTGQLNLAALVQALGERGDDPLARALLALLMVSLLIKAGGLPFFFWLPAAYPVLPPAMLALFSALATKVGVFALLRVSAGLPAELAETFLPWLGWLAVAGMVVGVLGAAYHYDTRRILAFHSVSQIGYMLLAVALGGTMGLAAALFFILHHMLVKSSLFLLGGMMARSGAGFDLRRSGGLLAARPMLAVLFALSAASLVGIPPLSGFWAKLLVVRESFALGQFAWGAAALAVGGLTLYSMVKIWIEAFWKPAPETANEAAPGPPRALPAGAWLASATLAGLTLAVGLAPQPLIDYLQLAAGAMLAPGAELPR